MTADNESENDAKQTVLYRGMTFISECCCGYDEEASKKEETLSGCLLLSVCGGGRAEGGAASLSFFLVTFLASQQHEHRMSGMDLPRSRAAIPRQKLQSILL